MRLATVVLQVVIAFVLTASFMPIVLVNVPASREPAAGSLLAAGMLAGLFAVIWALWPRRRR